MKAPQGSLAPVNAVPWPRAVPLCLIPFLALAAACSDGTHQRPEPSREAVPDELLALFESHGLRVHDGLSPPDVSGTFLHDSVTAAGGGPHFCNMRDELTADGAGTVSRRMTFTGPRCGGSAETSGIFISGADACFTLYLRSDSAAAGCSASVVSVASACLTPAGLTDYHEAFSDTVAGADCAALVGHGQLLPPGQVLLIEERDGLVARLP
jgi:hypothetical protein